MDLFLCDIDLPHERVKRLFVKKKYNVTLINRHALTLSCIIAGLTILQHYALKG